MIYTCKDCSYRGKSSGQGGGCPACGSFNLAGKISAPAARKSGKLRVILLIALWGYLFALIIWKLNH